MKPFLFAFALAITACAGTGRTVSPAGRTGLIDESFEDLGDLRVTRFDVRARVDVPPWRLWNALFLTDIGRVAEITGGTFTVESKTFEAPDRILLTVRVQTAWYLPSIHTQVRWTVHPAQFSLDQQGIDSRFDFYSTISIVPDNGGESCIIRYQGYLRRPWFLSHGRMHANILKNFEKLAPMFGLLAMRPEYANPNPRFPWNELNAFAAPAAAPAALAPAAVPAGDRPKFLIQDMVVSAGTATDATVIRLASGYLADKMASAGRFTVITDADVQLMARYLKTDWDIGCNQKPGCQEKILGMTRANFVFGGEIAHTGDRYTANLMLLNADTMVPVWRMNREIAATSSALRALVADVAAELLKSKF